MSEPFIPLPRREALPYVLPTPEWLIQQRVNAIQHPAAPAQEPSYQELVRRHKRNTPEEVARRRAHGFGWPKRNGRSLTNG